MKVLFFLSIILVSCATCDTKDGPIIVESDHIRYLINTNDSQCEAPPTLFPLTDEAEEKSVLDAHNYYCHSPAFEAKIRQKVAELQEIIRDLRNKNNP